MKSNGESQKGMNGEGGVSSGELTKNRSDGSVDKGNGKSSEDINKLVVSSPLFIRRPEGNFYYYLVYHSKNTEYDAMRIWI